jgi:hypothetical protein
MGTVRRRRTVTVHLPGDGPTPRRKTCKEAVVLRPAPTPPSGDLVYVGDGTLAGINCVIDGRHGTTTGVWREGGHIDAVFVKLDEGPMLHCLVSRQLPDGRPDHRRVIKSREVNRDQFDQIIGADEYRRDCGWRDTEPLGPDPDQPGRGVSL